MFLSWPISAVDDEVFCCELSKNFIVQSVFVVRIVSLEAAAPALFLIDVGRTFRRPPLVEEKQRRNIAWTQAAIVTHI
jgi:hypothetical protein